MDVENFLKNFVNKSENHKELITLFLDRGHYTFGSLFYKKNNTAYGIIDHVCTISNYNKDDISFTPFQHIPNIIISNISNKTHGYTAPYEISNIIIIPINVCNDVIGMLCLGNKAEDIREEDMEKIIDIVSLSQIIVNKFKLIEDYKKIYSDSASFSKDLFLANISHEIRTPLNGIIGFNQLLMKTTLDDTQKKYMSSISQCSIQLMKIINDVIDFSKLTSGNMKVTQECFAIKEIINIIKQTVKQRFIRKKQQCNFTVSGNVPEFIIMDKQKFIQIIVNLLSNAIKYTPIHGLIEIIITNQQNTLKVEVKDNGIGISEQDQCKLFNSFMQINNSLTKDGTGLGLAISKRLVELLNGEIKVKSALGKGSTFFFTCRHYQTEEMEKQLKQNSDVLKDKYILVVDDNQDNRILLADILFEWETHPIVCASAKEALKLISNDRYNFELGLLDICMPDIDGVELAEKIKNKNPLLPLIALSSVSDFVNVSNFEAKLDKPINKLQLLNIIYNVISQTYTDPAYIGKKNNSFAKLKNTKPISPTFSKKIKIIIAEDIRYNQTLLDNMIRSLGYNDITIASDGQETIEKLENAYTNNTPFIILLLDLRMPKMNGYEVIDYINNKGYHHPKIIAVTASVLEEDRSKCQKMGVEYFINKPINMAQLRNVLIKITQDTKPVSLENNNQESITTIPTTILTSANSSN